MTSLFTNYQLIKSGASKKIIFRFQKKKLNLIGIDFTKDKNEFHNFIKTYNILTNVNISIPTIYEINFDKSLILMEDFGNHRYDKIYKNQNLYDLLKSAVDSILVMQNSLRFYSLIDLKKYNFDVLKEEIKEIIDLYFSYKKIDSSFAKEFLDTWENEFYKYNFDFTSFVHKDFNMNNLFFLPLQKNHLRCGIIDFQSAYIGFSGWDLFSLLEDSRVHFTSQFNDELILYFYKKTHQKIDFEIFKQQYYFLNTSRQSRLLGRWIKLAKNLNQKDYFNYIYITLERLKESLFKLKNKRILDLYKRIL